MGHEAAVAPRQHHMTTSSGQPARSDAWQGIIITLVTAGVLLVIALDDGSSDVVVRQRWATMLWWAMALATAAGVTFRNRIPWPATLPIVGLLLFGGWTALSLRWTSSDELTAVEIARIGAYLGIVVAVASVVPRAHWRAVVAGAAVAAVAVCAYALASRLWPASFTPPITVFEGDSRRLSTPFGYWNAVGAWGAMSVALCIGLASHVQPSSLRAAAAAGSPIAATATYLAYSRASVVDIIIGLLIVVAVSRNRATAIVNLLVAGAMTGGVILIIRRHSEIADATGGDGWAAVLAALLIAAAATAAAAWAGKRVGLDRVRMSPGAARIALPIGLLAAIATVTAIAVVAGPQAWDKFTERKVADTADPAARLTSFSGNARYDQWRVALDEFEANPVKGTGAGTFEYTWNRDGFAGFLRDAHSLYLETLSELGVIGFALLLVFLLGIIGAFASALRRAPSAEERGVIAACAGAVTAYLIGAGVDWLWESPAVTVLALTLVGGVILAASGSAPAPRWRWRIAFIAAALVLTAVQLPGLVSTSEIRKSQSALRAGDVSAAREHANTAIDTQPWAASPLVQRALVDEKEGALGASRDELLSARQRAPLDWRISLLLARVEAKRGDSAAALAALRNAKRLRPKSQFFAGG